MASSGWAAQISVAPVWMMPALAVAMSSIVSPSHSVWSSPIGVITQVLACSTLVESSAPPRPDLDHGHVDRRVGERGQRHRGGHVEVGQGLLGARAGRGSCATGATSLVDLDELLLARPDSPSMLIRSRTVSRCGLV